MNEKLQTIEPASSHEIYLTAPLTQVGDKNTQIAHADNVIINNYMQTRNVISSISNNGGSITPESLTSADDQMATQTIKSSEIDTSCYNLFVIGSEIRNCRFMIHKERVLYDKTKIVQRLATLGSKAIMRIKTFPSLFMNENLNYDGKTSPEQEAYYGFVTDIKVLENGFVVVRFRCIAKIQQQRINKIASLLDIYGSVGLTELNRTHWTIKKVNLIEELIETELLPTSEALK